MTAGAGQTLKDLGEFGLISELTQRLGQSSAVVVGPGDDAAAVKTSDLTIASMDLLIQDRHFRLDWSSAADIGHKAAAVNLSDINAMGGNPTTMLVGLGAPSSLEVAWVLDFADAMAEEAATVGASIVGGDLTQADKITIAVTVLGECPQGPVLRSGARPGDTLVHVGRQGWADAGYSVLARGFKSPRAVVEAHRRPTPPYGAGAAAAQLGATAMIDVSDGLLQDLGHIADASGVAIDLDSSAFDLPEPVQAVGAAVGIDPMRLVLTGGDDYGLLATIPADVQMPDPWRVVGRVLDDGEPGAVRVDGQPYDEPSGHRHFS
jgi:thiamine-monophosphate kinase